MRGLYRLNRLYILCAVVFVFGQLSFAAPASHIYFFPNGYKGSSSCQMCHITQTDEIMDSVHYMWRSENPLVEFPGGGSHGMIDRACGLVGSNALINYDEQCGRCHIGDSLPFPDPQTGQFTDDQKANIDCLICHAADGMYDTNNDGKAEAGELADDKPMVYDADRDVNMWHQDRSDEAAKSVGFAVSNEACLRCHHHGQADYHYKRGTPFEAETDVHAAAGVLCTDCHSTDHHKIARGSRVTDMFAWERQDVDVKCENCHTEAPHVKTPMLNTHIDKIGCETCHIPEVAGTQRRVWASTMGVTEGPESQVPIFDEESGKWLPYSEYDEGLTSPSYRWFAGGASMLAEPIATPGAFNMQPATRQTPGAKILPFRKFISGQPMDAMGIPQMPDFNPNFTMAAALTQMAPMLQMAGFMRPEGMTPEEEAMMSQFPNMLLFDRSDYFTNGNVAEAVSIGMAKQGAFMQAMDIRGMSRDDLIAMGSQMWSGQVAGLDLPDNPYAPGYVADQDPTTATGSYITVSHAIKLEGALSCNDCHTENGRLDFEALGYSEEKQEKLVKLSGIDHTSFIGDAYQGPAQCESCHQGMTAKIMQGAHYKFESDLPQGYQFDDEGNEVTFTKSGKLWKLCGFPTTLPQFNWLGVLKDLPETDHVDAPGGCAKCHIGTGVKPFTATGNTEPQPSEASNVDCLICHADQYSRKFYVATQDGEPVLSPLNAPVVMVAPKTDGVMDWSVYTDAAKTVGATSAKTCNRCHASAGGGKLEVDGNHTSFKRGSVYAPGHDVHADAGLDCSDCHYAGDHKFKRPLNNDLSAHDVVVDHQMCEDCHTDAPHENSMYNTHLDKIACTTCHATSTKAATAKDFSTTVAPDPENPVGLFKVSMEFSAPAPIEYRWFNGTVGPEITARGNLNDGKIYPFRTVTFNQPVDIDNNPIPLKWGVFFKSGDMQLALQKGRALYESMVYSPENADTYGIPAVPGEFDHFNTGHNGGFSVSHGITKTEALSCADCHTENGKLDFEALGYSEEKQEALTDPSSLHASIQEYKGPETCVQCHTKQASDMFGSVHYQWDGPTPNVPNIAGNAGKGNDSFNTYCGATNASRRVVCWKCHVGNGKVVTKNEDAEQLNNIDCLMCHQDAYKRKAAPTIPVGDYNQDFSVNMADFANLASSWASVDDDFADLTYDGQVNAEDVFTLANHWLERGGGQMFTFIDYQDIERTWTLPYEGGSGNLTLVPDVANMAITPLEAAQTVHMPTRMSCLQCHATSGGGNGLKRGDLAMASADAPVEADVHLSAGGANMTCQACHQTQDHKMLGRGIDLRVNDRPEMLTCDSLDCHTSKPHVSTQLNRHTTRIACQTCHISSYAKLAPTETHRDWLDPHWVQGVYSGQGGYKPREHTASDLMPTYGWYNGTSEVYKLGQVPTLREDGTYEIAAPLGDVKSEGSKIYPMKEHTSVLGMHDETGQMIPYSTTKFFFTGKFEDAIADGLAERNLTGDWSIVTGHTYQSLNHGVEPKENALTCDQCHGNSGVRIDLQNDMGYAVKDDTQHFCMSCHVSFPGTMSFTGIHSLHVDEWNIPCSYCHTFSRPERNLNDCSKCH